MAASIGPYGAALADGSEYRGRYGLSVAELAEWHRPRLDVLADAGPDVLALETIPDIDEAEALVALVRQLGVPAWLSYTIDGAKTRAGQPLADAFAVAAGVPEIVAVGVNCCAPADVLPAVAVARETTEAGDRLSQQWRETGTRTDAHGWARRGSAAELAPRWIAEGARIVGGCCRVRPADIADIAARRRVSRLRRSAPRACGTPAPCR